VVGLLLPEVSFVPDGERQEERYNECVLRSTAMMLNKQGVFGGTVLIVSSKSETGKGNTLAALFLLSFMQVVHPLTLTPSVPSECRTENYITPLLCRVREFVANYVPDMRQPETAVTLLLNDDIRMTVHLVT